MISIEFDGIRYGFNMDKLVAYQIHYKEVLGEREVTHVILDFGGNDLYRYSVANYPKLTFFLVDYLTSKPVTP